VSELSSIAGEGAKRVYGITADVGTAEGAASLIKEVDALGNLDVLVNNVAIFYAKKFEDITDDDWVYHSHHTQYFRLIHSY
jgi:NAD(P)-dependent dehydrogenase (short-subunit alcohol dehydrogenase family)